MTTAQENAFDLRSAVAVLERTPAGLTGMLAGLPESWLQATEGDASWSPREVVGHLINGERTNWIPRARHILAGRSGVFEPFDRTARFDERRAEGISELLDSFAEHRRKSLAELRAMQLTSADLGRKGQHPELGEVRLDQLLATWVVHDLDHLGQIVRTMAKHYRVPVGPWSAYLSILRDRE